MQLETGRDGRQGQAVLHRRRAEGEHVLQPILGAAEVLPGRGDEVEVQRELGDGADEAEGEHEGAQAQPPRGGQPGAEEEHDCVHEVGRRLDEEVEAGDQAGA